MKNALILHGTSSNPNQFWFPYLKTKLEEMGYKVTVPQLPDPDNPTLAAHIPFILDSYQFNSETVIIGHSAGACLILGILDAINVKIHQAIMVGGFLVSPDGSDHQIVKKISDYNWSKMKQNVGQMTIINSTNDPWGINDKSGRQLFEHIGDRLIIHHEGHMGSVSFNQPYPEFPLLVKLIELAEVI